jgi:nucleoside-diphosphate-sugar epimerase
MIPELTGEVINIGRGEETSVLELSAAVLELTGSSSQVVHVDPWPGNLPRLLAETTRARKLCPYPPTTALRDGLAQTIEHFAAGDLANMLEQEVERNWQ